MAINAKAAQDFVPIKEVRDGVIVLKEGGMRAVLICSSINLSLKSSDEQIAIINSFQSFLNSLDFSTQIVMQSRRLDIRPYLLTLENRQKEQTEPLLKIQTKEYIEFIRSFTEEVNIMTKTFFVVVPFNGTMLGNKISGNEGVLESLLSSKKNSNQETNKMGSDLAAFEENRSQLDQRIGVIIGGLGRLGVKSSQLNTEEVVELFYKTFNPGDISQGIKLQ